MRNIRLAMLVIVFFAFSIIESSATHLRAGDIVVERENCSSRTFKITITVYTNTKSDVRFGGEGEVLNFGDGTWELVPKVENTLRPDLDTDGTVATASYTRYHTYPSTGTYVISYREPNRNEGVLNMNASINTTFYLETVIKIDAFLGCNNTPKLKVPPIDQACPGVAWTHNPGAFDPDGDRLTYALVVPFSDRRTEVINYRDPNHPNFYNNYNNANEAGVGPPTFFIDPNTGTVTWDAPGAIGEYNIAFHVIEWRFKNGEWVQLGYVRRDMQILVDDCDNKRPDLILPADTCIVAGTILNETIFGIDPDNDNVKIEAYSEIFNFPSNQSPATYSPVPGVKDFQPSVPPAELKFQWKTECAHVKEQPYQVVFKITDDPPNGAKLVTFKTWFITVVGPAPEWEAAQLNLTNRSTELEWDPYFCQGAEKMQVWRKVDGSPFEPDNCETGMPESLGYQLITEVGIKDENQIPITAYTDTNGGRGLAPGARYCYRLVAIFPFPKGGESYVSKDTCIGPILADVPIMTHVSVEKTDVSAGEIRVSWKRPFEADPSQFPKPYRYALYRALGFTRGSDSVLVASNLSDTTFLDTGLNTEDNVYNYSVTAYASNSAPVGSSFPASSVRLTAQSQVGRIQLSWSAFVPWSNQIHSFPSKHRIYRGDENTSESEMVLIDSVDVLADGFRFVDQGQHGTLEPDKTYCYRIMTRGGYGNPAIDEPLENFSQIICAQLGDTIPPCKPTLMVNALNCEEFLADKDNCGSNLFQNTIYWERNREDSCDTNILGYRIYRGLSAGGEFVRLESAGIVTDTFYIDTSVASFAYCYKISAVDRSLNESELSDAVCNDNCPYYELPNVFTPNGDNCNDLFSAYSDRNLSGEEGGCLVSEEALTKCARFVESVIFRVYNRWGQEVYSYEGSIRDENKTIYIDWDGRDNMHNLLSTGVYYYVAEVTFDIVSSDKTKVIKGWVHLVR
ncbi:MAG TPA: gliding motility-associated C-terminal domain-containing protein [Chryseolinea sp.]|nr:gliding motility-associated C-terminal domain-containing protein [Chryseolinea sp.]